MLRPDSGGAGEWRGGCGIERSWTLTGSKAILSILAERVKFSPWGLRGGGPGARGEYILTHINGELLGLPSKCTVPLERGDTLIIRTPGGGGYGDPLKRNPELVLKDVLNGLISPSVAEEIYGVIIDLDKGEELKEKTRRLRKVRDAQSS